MSARRRRVLFKLLTITLPTVVVTGLVLGGIVEGWVRWRWDPRKGSPGLFVSDPVLGQRLAAGYDGWFAGVPTRINNLGYRDERDYELAKRPNTFRILVLGDSVTFGHGSVHAYPRLLEDLLRRWRSDRDWQVWNAAVPGYNTTQELAQLHRLGPQVRPDLVIVGFYDNDLSDNRPPPTPGVTGRARSRILSWAQRHVYSLELYKRLALQIGWKLSGEDAFRLRLEHLGTESALLENVAQVANLEEQNIRPYDRLTDEEIAALDCAGGARTDPKLIPDIERQPGYDVWMQSVREFQRLHRDGAYRIVFFMNIVPPACPGRDFFFEGTTRIFNDYLMGIVATGVPAVSTFEGFLRYRPSQMPAARAHAIGNSNTVKAEILFDYLQSSVLLGLIN